jgi:shikimate dehydrogenase
VNVSPRTACYGLLGHPVAHSLSPAMHNAAYAALGLDAVYLAMDVPPGRLSEGIHGAHALGFQGLNVTVPHKRGACAAALSLDPVARLTGAVNTLRRSGQGWMGFNTDAPATLELLQAAGVGPGARALLFGAGGAARAGACALLQLGALVEVAARREEAARELCDGLRPGFPSAHIEPVDFHRAQAGARERDVLVNATSIGLAGHGFAAAVLPREAFRAGQVALDYVYGDTAFARDAREAGAVLVAGEQILVRQGALAFTLWTGRPAPEAAMVAALRAASGGSR